MTQLPAPEGDRAHDRADEAVEPIAIIGMAARVPGAADVARFWENLVGGVESLTRLSRERMAAAGATESELDDPNLVAAGFVLDDSDMFDADLFGMTPREADVTDPQHRVFLELCHGALEDAGYDPARYPGDIGVYAGRGTERYRWEHVHRNHAVLATTPSMAVGIGNLSDNVTTLVSYKLDLRGPSAAVYTACSTSLVAVHMAADALRAGDCDMALAGGVSIEFPQDRGHVHHEGGVASADGHVRSFDAAATGTMWGSGGGAVLLKPLADALRDGDRVCAVILGNAINNDGAGKVGFTAPGVDGQAAVIANALAQADVDPRTISYVEAHGTATPLGDPIEMAALTRVYARGTDDREWCGIGSVKSNIGHLSQGAGVVGVIKTALAMEHGLIPPSLNYTSPNPAIDFAASPFYVNATLSKWERDTGPRRAAVSSFGIGGTNAHVILEEAPPREDRCASPDPELLQVSARDATALAAGAERLADRLAALPDPRLADVAHTLRVGRTEHPHRGFVVAATADEAVAGLREPKRRNGLTVPDAPSAVVFLFTGQGAQYGGMGARLYEREPVFAAAVDECASVLGGELGADLRTLMFATGEEADAALARTELTQPALFTLEYALATLWKSWRVRPDGMIGHSVGEYVAATLAGVFELPGALRLVATRGRLMGSLPPGAMAAISRDEAEIAPLLPEGLSIATVNGPGTCVVAGPEELVEELAGGLGEEVSVKRLRTSHAFHSPMMDAILPAFTEAVAAVPLRTPTAPFLSTVSGEPITGAQATDPGYWASQLRETVRFGACVAAQLATGPSLFVECGPGRQLAGLVRMQTRDGSRPAVPSLPGPAGKLSEIETLYTAAGTLWTHGIPVAPPSRGRRVSLPGYAYQRTRHWVDADPVTAGPGAGARAEDHRLPPSRRFAVPSWRQLPPAPAAEPPASCVLFAADELGSATAGLLRSAGCAVTEVVPGDTYARAGTGYAIRPDVPEDYAALLADLDADLGAVPGRFVHAWALAGGPAGDVDATWAAQRLGLFSVVRLVQALAGSGRPAGIDVHIDVVTAATQHVVGDDLSRPEHATVAGVVRSAPFDVPGMRLRHVDCTAATRPADLAGVLGRPAGDALLALRDRRVWTVGFDQVELPEAGEDVVREGGVYLITGGLGGLGLVLGETLAERRRARLVLTSRSGLPPREEWDGYLRGHGPGEKMGRAVRAVRRMESAGAEVLTAAVDVSDVDALRNLRAELLARFGRLDGIVHAAGIAGGGLVETRDITDMRAVLAPKVAGAVALRAVFGADELDFVSLFSSVTGTAGGLAETDYCAANAYLDAHASAGGWRAPVRSLGWAGWLEVGMLADMLEPGAGRGDEGAAGPAEPPAHPLVTEIRRAADGTTTGHGTVSAGTHWALDEHRIDGVPVLPGTAQLEAVRATAAAGTGAPVELTDVLFLEPFAVPDGSTADLRVTIGPRADGSAPATLTGGGTTYCRATVAWPTTQRGAALDLDAVRARCTPRPDLASGSHAPPGALVTYGAHWRTVRDVWRSAGEQLTLLEVPEDQRGDLAGWGFSPAVLDQATFVFDGAGGGALPMGYGRLLVHGPLPARVWVHRGLATPGSDAVASDIRTDSFTVVDDHGTELVSVTDFLLRRMDSVRPAAARRAPAAPADAEARWLAPAEGVDAFLRSLRADVGGHVLITPRSLDWVVEQVARDARAALGGGAPAGGEPVAQATPADPDANPTEAMVAGIWSSVLGVTTVRADSDFFDLGGNSLVAVQLIAQIREATGVRLPMRAIFETPTVAEMAVTITAMSAAPPAEPEPSSTIRRLARSSDRGPA
ncbi:type I polyketide synthase [Actinophytocola sp.]|uniref:type I polyketide synthase n=1 Tax=Actinophytocola sp. TaxID=1872138 RepID=UPI0025BF4D40|nr:type I polyketide synthase [Actinophytocola sp.]